MSKNEKVDTSLLKLGNTYSRTSLENILGIVKVFHTGIREFNNCIFFYVTLDKSNKPVDHKYNDYFEGDIFYWESQKRQHSGSEVLRSIINGIKIPHLFIRKYEGERFTYLGELKYIEHDENTNYPVQFSFERLNFLDFDLDEFSIRRIENIIGHELRNKGISKQFSDKSRNKVETTSQGYSSNPKLRKAVEDHAMELAMNYYKDHGYNEIKDVSLEKIGYDIYCQDQDFNEIRIEVKGTQSNGSEINLTKNEVKNAKLYQTSLFIVHSIKIDSSNNYKIKHQGEIKIIENWQPDENDLTPITYKYKVPE